MANLQEATDLGKFSESDIYYNSSGHIAITLDFVHVVIFPDDERPGLFCYGIIPLRDGEAVYVDANS